MATHCRECGRPLNNVKGKMEKEFCPRKERTCRDDFHNKRKERGVLLYDLLMTERYTPEGAYAHQQTETHLKEWHDDDLKTRDGRPSWNVPPKDEEKRT